MRLFDKICFFTFGALAYSLAYDSFSWLRLGFIAISTCIGFIGCELVAKATSNLIGKNKKEIQKENIYLDT